MTIPVSFVYFRSTYTSMRILQFSK